VTAGTGPMAGTRQQHSDRKCRPPKQVGDSYGRAALEGELDRIRFGLTGERHLAIFHAGLSVGELAAGGHFDDRGLAEAERLIVETGVSIGKPRSEVERHVRNGIARGRTQPRTAPNRDGSYLASRSDAVWEVFRWWSSVASRDWPGTKGSTSLKVAAGLTLIALRAGKVRLTISVREVEQAAGVGRGTAQRRLEEFMGLGLIRRVTEGNRFTGQAAEFQLVVPRASWDSHSISAEMVASGCPNLRGGLLSPSHDMWARWANGWRIYRLLADADGTMTVGELAEVICIHQGSVRRILSRLAAHGLVAGDCDGGWSVRPDAERAAQGASPPVGEHRRARHRAERQNHRRWLDERAASGGPARPPEPEPEWWLRVDPPPEIAAA